MRNKETLAETIVGFGISLTLSLIGVGGIIFGLTHEVDSRHWLGSIVLGVVGTVVLVFSAYCLVKEIRREVCSNACLKNKYEKGDNYFR